MQIPGGSPRAGDRGFLRKSRTQEHGWSIPSVLHQEHGGRSHQWAVTRLAVIVPVNVTSGVPFSLNSVPLSGEPGYIAIE